MIHISRISLKNFKSFKRISIPIPQGFTAIVGPNGSGKSNIVDAICFVLGRSSAKSLRAERFSDLIFNGGKKEKPASEAEVSLYLDNSGREIPLDSKEIKITRSIDVAGNSVYRLNGKRTSRTEILDVLSAAKIQPDGHNIVLQGDVTRIVEMNPIERRGVIDEIAGIAEYDEKKRKALRELEKVSENVSKVEAVLNEVKEQLQKLEKEKNDALRHEFLKREIRRSKGVVLYSSHIEVSAGIEKLNRAIQEEEERTKRIDKYLNILLLKLEVKKKELEKLNADIILKEETEQFEIFRELEKLKNELTYHEEKLSAAKAEIAQLEERYARCSSNTAAVSEEIKNYEASNEVLEKEQRSIENKISQLKAEVDKEYEKISKEDKVALDKRERLTNVRTKFEEERSKLLEFERENALLNERKAEKSRIYQELRKEIAEKKAKLDELNKLKKAISDEKNSLDANLEKALSQKSALIDESIELRKKIQKSNALIQFNIEKLSGLRAKFGALEQVKKTSFNEAIEAVLKLKESGIYGTIAQLGRVNPKFSKALEAAAGRGLQFIVVDTDATAEKCINYLKEKRIGRATFLPLNKLQVAQPDANAKKIASKTYGFALELVDFDEKFKKAFAYVFRDTLVVKDLAFARSAIGEARMVTLDGDLVEKSGSMSGGFYKPSELSFEEADASKKEIEALEGELKKLEKEREALLKKEEEVRAGLENLASKEVDSAREKEVLSERLRTCSENIEELRKLVAEREVLSSEISSELKEISKKMEANEKEIKALSGAVSKLGEEKNSIETELQTSEVEKVLKNIKNLELQIFELEKERESKKNQRSLSDSKISEILSPRISELQAELKEITSAKKKLEAQVNAIEEKKRELETAFPQLKEKESTIIAEIDKSKARREFFVKGIEKISRKNDSLREELTEISRKTEHSKIERARLEAKLEEINKTLVSYSDLKFDIAEPIDTADLEGEIAKMEAEMASLEPINMRAIEDFEAVKEKFGSFATRVQKLQEEKNAILKLMEEIEHRKKAVFMEVFENVAANFRRIFSQLSNGGSAELLLDEVNPLEDGLQIQAKPEGRNPQYIELMSGGEKTLTALSFIFAIQRYQPAPFYVLDEIDMFLDDENVKKASDLVKDSSKEAQFIVVSLRDSLMASADQLFGISNEDGVSKIVGVELEIGN